MLINKQQANTTDEHISKLFRYRFLNSTSLIKNKQKPPNPQKDELQNHDLTIKNYIDFIFRRIPKLLEKFEKIVHEVFMYSCTHFPLLLTTDISMVPLLQPIKQLV